MKVNKMNSRYGAVRHIKSLGGGCYTVEGESRYYRGACAADGEMTMFDFEGGPCIFVGEKFECDPSNPDAVVESLLVEKSDKENWAKVSVVVK